MLGYETVPYVILSLFIEINNFYVAGRRIPGADPADRVVPVGHGRGRGHALLGAAVPEAHPEARLGRDLHHGHLDAPLHHYTPQLQVSFF